MLGVEGQLYLCLASGTLSLPLYTDGRVPQCEIKMLLFEQIFWGSSVYKEQEQCSVWGQVKCAWLYFAPQGSSFDRLNECTFPALAGTVTCTWWVLARLRHFTSGSDLFYSLMKVLSRVVLLAFSSTWETAEAVFPEGPAHAGPSGGVGWKWCFRELDIISTLQPGCLWGFCAEACLVRSLCLRQGRWLHFSLVRKALVWISFYSKTRKALLEIAEGHKGVSSWFFLGSNNFL